MIIRIYEHRILGGYHPWPIPTRLSLSYDKKMAVISMIAGAIAFQLMTWLIPYTVGDAVSVAILDVVLGAVYPCSTAVFAKLSPRKIWIAGLSFIGALGSSGGAFFPVLTGSLAQNVGSMVLHYFVWAMVTSWLCLPRILKRSESVITPGEIGLCAVILRLRHLAG